MTKWINYHHLYYFMTIAESGSVSKAAQTLRIGQPTLSAQLKVFEEGLAVRLFERQHKRLFLTEQGKIALDYARNIFKLGDEMYEALHDRLKPTRIHLRIGALDSVSKQVMLQLTEEAYQFAPCQISIVEGKYEDLILGVAAHKIDLAIANFQPKSEMAKNLNVRLLTKKQVCVFGAKKFKSLRNQFPQSLAGQPFVLPTYDSHLRYDLESWFQNKNIIIDTIAESQDAALKKQMACKGRALMTAPLYAVEQQVQSGELVEIGRLEGLKEELFLISARRKIENPVATHLMKAFKI